MPDMMCETQLTPPACRLEPQSPRTWIEPEHPELLRSLATGLRVLECFNATQQILDLAQLTDMLSIQNPSKLRRHTSVLLTGRYLEQTAAQDYRLSSHAGDIALSMLDTLALCRHTRDALRQLRGRTGYTSSLVALDDLDVVYLARLTGSRQGQHTVDDGIGIGARLPAHRTAAGKILMAHLPPSKRKERLAEITLAHRNSDNPIRKHSLHIELMTSRRTGFAIHGSDGSRSIAAPIKDDKGRTVAAIEITTPASRVSLEALIESFSPQLLHEAEAITVTADEFST